MLRALWAFTLIVILLSACTQRTICPAFQSAYIYDKDKLRQKFSYFQEDSTPKIYSANKTKYLIAERTTYHKKVRSLKTVPMKDVNVTVPDSLTLKDDPDLGKEGEDGEDGVTVGSELDMAARSVVDSTFIVDVPRKEEAQPVEDSVYVISKDKEVRFLKYDFPDSLILDASTGRYVSETPRYAVVNITFNVEQDNYMWYLKDYLVLPDVKLARNQQKGGDTDESGTADKKKTKKGVKGFFKNLFKKKKKKEEEQAPVEEAPVKKSEEEEFDYIDEEATPPAEETAEEQPTDKKRKKEDRKSKKEKKKKEEPKEEEPKPPVEDTEEKKIPEKVDEDGF
jgi:hypothetical protein